jgi:diaminohydroxyphosphoribosylaminopyrimidine deaminase/5-amino-6-(5-phosphoribosylamino)uracil reductase
LKGHITEFDVIMMRRTLELAARGRGLVSPNPLVGCIVVSPESEVAGEGTYLYDGVTHAEALAIDQAGPQARGGTAYISLEPHHHHSKTPPCTEALIAAGIRRVVCPIEDPNPLVSGGGFAALREAGIEVVTGVLAAEAAKLNEKFICWHRNGRPFVHLKLAMSMDGRISAGKDTRSDLTGPDAAMRVQELRHDYDAILVGSNTVAVDDPLLTDRSGLDRRRPLVRVVLDNRLRLASSSRLVSTAGVIPTIVFTNSRDKASVDALKGAGVDVITSDSGSRDLTAVLGQLRDREIQSILVEGGTEIAGAFCDEKLVDKFTFVYAPIVIGGRDAPDAIGGTGLTALSDATRLQDVTVDRSGDDIMVTGYPVR